MTGIRLFSMLNPAIGLIFALVFLLLWLSQRQRTYILVMAGATFAFAAAVLSQVFLFHESFGINAVLSCFFYLVSLCLFIESVAMRVGVRRNYYGSIPISGVILFLIYYYFYVERDLNVRIYVLNVGIGILFCYAAARLAMAGSTRLIDRVLFWLILLAGLHFLPRTILTLLADRESGNTLIRDFGSSTFWTLLNFSMIVISLLLCLCFLLAVVLDIIDDLNSDRNRDSLTPLLNRRGFEEAALKCLARPAAADICLVFCDIDHFKQINDALGHATGDVVIRLIGQWIGEATRHGDVAGRIGGEEFAILLSGTGRKQALAFAERLRARVEDGSFPGLPDGQRVTASFGVAQAGIGEPLEHLMRHADEMLYRAKRNGRNRVDG